MRSLIIRWMGSFGLLGYGWVGDGLKVGARQRVGGLGGIMCICCDAPDLIK